ncbi:MAG: SemiSWEET transporter [Proteobacteria bacterium]|nr:SemiSWEET transporter [Pseudomonadota bacterium]
MNELAHSKEYIVSGGGNWIKFLEPTMVMIGVIGPFALLPQVIKIYITHSEHAGGHSLIDWSLFAILSLIWLSYGLYEKKPSIYIGNTISLIRNLLMIVGILIQAGITY